MSDNAVYVNDVGDVIASYIDDFILFGLSLKRLKTLAQGLYNVRLDQQQYIEKALQTVELEEGRAASTPFNPKGQENLLLREVGEPNISFATLIWAQFMSNPSPEHVTGIKKMMKYLRGITKRSIRYCALNEKYPHYAYNKLGLHSAVDSNYTSDPTTARWPLYG
ncbi:hypothetical protein K445DRAFT_7784 [Daldinia sp. EC12]|nr:hypothetical protein K445DRAFT_7784 [Daldinia sp. EC12]